MRQNQFSSFAILLIAFALSGVVQASEPNHPCIVVRGAYDVGTSGIKLSSKIVDVCQRIVVKDLVTKIDKEKIAFGKRVMGASMEKGKQKEFGAEWLIETKKQFKNAHDRLVAATKALGFDIDDHVGIATHAFRVSSDGADFLKTLLTDPELKMDIRQVTQAREGENEFAGVQRSNIQNAKLQTPIAPTNMASWGIGDGSQQFVTASEGKKPGEVKMLSYVSAIAAGTFKNGLMHALGRSGDVLSPLNGLLDFMKALQLVDTELEAAVKAGNSSAFVERMKTKSPKVFGVGGIHTGAIENALRMAYTSPSDDMGLMRKDDVGTYYTYADLSAVTTKMLGMSEVEVVAYKNRRSLEAMDENAKNAVLTNSDQLNLARTQVSSMILVMQTMYKLGVEKVYVSNADATAEIFFMEEFLPEALKAKVTTPVRAPKAAPAKAKPAPVKTSAAPVGRRVSPKEAACMNFVKEHPQYFSPRNSRYVKAPSWELKGPNLVCILGTIVESCKVFSEGIITRPGECYGQLMTPKAGNIQVYIGTY